MTYRRLNSAAAAAALISACAAIAGADPVRMEKTTVDGGGVSFVASRNFTLGGTIGQPDAGLMIAGAFRLVGGFWGEGEGGLVSVESDSIPSVQAAPPASLKIHPAAPNPLLRATTLRLEIPAASETAIEIFDLGGAFVRELLNRPLPAGSSIVTWDGCDAGGKRVAAGLYFVQIRVGANTSTQKVVVVR